MDLPELPDKALRRSPSLYIQTADAQDTKNSGLSHAGKRSDIPRMVRPRQGLRPAQSGGGVPVHGEEGRIIEGRIIE